MKPLLASLTFLAAVIAPAFAEPAMQSASLPQGDTTYVYQGEGDAVILVHGLGADMSRWHANLDGLAEDHRIIALDLYGFGASARLDTDYRAQIFVDQIEQLRMTLGLRRVSLVGNSMGGWVSLLYAEQYPENVHKLVLVAPAFYYGVPDHVTADQLTVGASPQTVDAMQVYLRRVYANPPTDLRTVEALLVEHTEKNTGNAIPSMAKSIKDGLDTLTSDRISQIDAPTLIIQGDADGIVSVTASQALTQDMSNARLVIYEGIGHWPQEEARRLFNSDVSEFLKASE